MESSEIVPRFWSLGFFFPKPFPNIILFPFVDEWNRKKLMEIVDFLGKTKLQSQELSGFNLWRRF